MRIFVEVKTRKREQKIERHDDTHFSVHLRSMAIEGKANRELKELLADYFNTSVSCVEIYAGKTAAYKIIDIII